MPTPKLADLREKIPPAVMEALEKELNGIDFGVVTLPELEQPTPEVEP